MSTLTTPDSSPTSQSSTGQIVLVHHKDLARVVAEEKGIFISYKDAADDPKNVWFSSIKNRFGEEVNTYMRTFE